MAKNTGSDTSKVRDGELKESAGRLNRDANKALKAVGYTALALQGDVGGLAKKAALDAAQNEDLLKKAEQGLEKVADIPAVPRSLTQNFAKASRGVLGAVPLLSIPIKLLSAEEIAKKVLDPIREREYGRAGVELCSQLSQTFLGTAAGSAFSEGIGLVAAKIDPRYAPEKSAGRQTIESLVEGGGQVYDILRERVSSPVPALPKLTPV